MAITPCLSMSNEHEMHPASPDGRCPSLSYFGASPLVHFVVETDNAHRVICLNYDFFDGMICYDCLLSK